MFLQRTSRVLDSGRPVAANLSSFCRDAIRLIAAEVHAEVAGCDSDAEGRKKKTHTETKKPPTNKNNKISEKHQFFKLPSFCVCVCARARVMRVLWRLT